MADVPDRIWVKAVVKDGELLQIASYSSECDEALGNGHQEYNGTWLVQFSVSLPDQMRSAIERRGKQVAQLRLSRDREQAEADAALTPEELTAELDQLCNRPGSAAIVRKDRYGHAIEVVLYEQKKPARALSPADGLRLMRMYRQHEAERCQRKSEAEERERAEWIRYMDILRSARGRPLKDGERRRQFRAIDYLRKWEAENDSSREDCGEVRNR